VPEELEIDNEGWWKEKEEQGYKPDNRTSYLFKRNTNEKFDRNVSHEQYIH